MRYTITVTLLYMSMIFVQPFLPPILGNHNWLLSLTPNLLVYCSLRARDFSLVFFVIIGGLLHDMILLDYLGLGPLLWGLTAFLARSQKPWLTGAHWVVICAISFACCFFYMSTDRLFFLAYHEFWSWDMAISINILTTSIINSLLAPLFFIPLDWILRTKEYNREELPNTSYPYAHH